ncbi:MAG TPA: lipoate--protein ligase family protein [Candidatus Saccharimonadales bacterium]|nr:lipoate--protein ligase family protein [Candidatus Saccharimonadales bacterium]
MTGLKLLDLTCDTPAENLACDEVLLDACEAGEHPGVLRFWEAQQTFVVLGYGNRAASEANVDACRKRGIGILRRCSGGGAVLQLPGCLNYALVLNFENTPGLHSITDANCTIMRRHEKVVSALLGQPIGIQGVTDLTWGELKFSGNSQRRKRRSLLFHGTFLLDAGLELIEECLRSPSKEPEYRQHRSHRNFVTNLNLSAVGLKNGLAEAWRAGDRLEMNLGEPIRELVETKYGREEWNLKW